MASINVELHNTKKIGTVVAGGRIVAGKKAMIGSSTC